MKKKLQVFLLLFMLHNICYSQQIIRQSIGSIGFSEMVEGLLIRQTIGQAAPTEVIRNDANALRQGFQQPLFFNAELCHFCADCENLRMYPNPVLMNHTVNLISSETLSWVKLTDLQGKELIKKNNINSESSSMDISRLSSGVYLVQVTTSAGICYKKLIVTR
jgi:hypothetical protein